MRFVTKAAACLLALNVLLLILLVAAQTLDSTKIRERLRKDAQFGRLTQGNQYQGPFGQVLDMYTECIALSSGTLPPEGRSALTRALEHRYIEALEGGKGNPCGALNGNLVDADAVEVWPYPRYWHGYDVYLRPMLRAGIPIARIRFINLLLIAILTVGLIHASARLLPMPIVASLMGTLFVTTDALSLPFVTAHALGFMVCLATAWAGALRLRARPDDFAGLRWIALCSGAVFAFVDFLVNPPLTPTLLLFLMIAATRWNRPGVPARRLLLSCGAVALTWFASYATTWAGKWVFTAIFLGPQKVMDDVFPNIVKRTMGLGDISGQVSVHIGTATMTNVNALGLPLFVTALACAAALLALACSHGRFTRERMDDFLIVSSPALIPFTWMELLRNHSIVHPWFVFRSLGLSLGIVVAASMFVLLAPRRPRTDSAPAPAQE